MTCLEGNTHRLADVGNRVHTRNDSDEDVRGNACKKAIAWKALPGSPDKPGGLSIQLCKSEKKELYIRYSP